MRNSALSRLPKIFGWLVLALSLAFGPQFLVVSAMAQGHGHGSGGWHGGGGHDGGGWHGGGWHGGGWYGGIGLGWGWPYYWGWPYDPYGYDYYYPPVYPAPAVVMPPVPATPAPSSSWYYCANPKGYYPYVQSCQGAWQPVPAVPPGVHP